MVNMDEYVDGIASIIEEDDAESLDEMIHILAGYESEKLCAYAESNTTIKKFLDENSTLSNCWSERLEKLHYPSKKIVPCTLDEKPISVFTLLEGVTFFSKFSLEADSKNINALQYLDKACEFKLFDALVARINLNLQNLIDAFAANDSKEKTDAILKKIQTDINTLTSNYWSVGYAKAADAYFQLGNIYAALNEKEHSADTLEQAMEYMHKSWVHFYAAEDIKKLEPSQSLVSTISPLLLTSYFQEEDMQKATSNEQIESFYKSKIHKNIKKQFTNTVLENLKTDAEKIQVELEHNYAEYSSRGLVR